MARPRAHSLVLATSLALALTACGVIVGIRDTVEATPGADASPFDGPPDIDTATADARSDVDLGAPRDAALDVRALDGEAGDAALVPDADADASADAGAFPITGGELHFLQPGENIAIGYTTADGPAELVLTANGAFTFPAPARSVRVVTAPPGRRCWSRAVGDTGVDVRCVFAERREIPAAQTDSATYTPIPGGASRVVTDLAKTTLLVAFSMPFATTSGPEVVYPDYSTLLVRAIVDGDPAQSIELRRGSTFWHQPWNQTLLGTVDVGPGTHDVVIEFAHTLPNPIAGRRSLVGGTAYGVTFGSELLTVALDSVATYRRTLRSELTASYTLATKNAWMPMSSLSGSADAPSQALVMAYYPDVFFTQPPLASDNAGFFALMTGAEAGASLVSHTMRHVKDENGYRSIALTAAADVNGPFTFRVDQRTEHGPNVAAPRRGGALTAMLFGADANLQSFAFSADGNYAGTVGAFNTIPGTTFNVRPNLGRALVFFHMNLVTMTNAGYAGEIQLMDGAKTLVNGIFQSWSFEYGQGVSLATIADFSGDGHQLSVRVRTLNGEMARVHHTLVPDARGRSLITLVPFE